MPFHNSDCQKQQLQLPLSASKVKLGASQPQAKATGRAASIAPQAVPAKQVVPAFAGIAG